MSLSVRNFLLIDEAHLEFETGFHVLTGETGAGKSILLDALGLIRGERASAQQVRAGAKQAVVEALFSTDGRPEALRWLEEMGFEPAEEILLVREVGRQGKSVCRINGRTVTVQMLRDLAARLIDVYGQHEHQSLLQPDRYARMLDGYGDASHQTLLEEYRRAHDLFTRADADLRAAQLGEEERLQRIDWLLFQLGEIRDLSPAPGEEEELEAEHRRLSHAGRILEDASRAYEMLDEGGQGVGAVTDVVAEIVETVEGLVKYDPGLAGILEMLQSAAANLSEAAHELRRYLETIEADPQKLQSVQERLHQLRRLMRKYGGSVESILESAATMENELSRLRNYEADLQERSEARIRAWEGMVSAARRLSLNRLALAERIQGKVQEQLRELAMPRAQFRIEVRWLGETEKGFRSDGADQVEFLFSANPGEPPAPLSKVASGGELSRLMLALKVVLADADDVPTLIFDEVDAGMSGQAAVVVGEKLVQVARRRQVICVTHLPQIAAMADGHHRIRKEQTEESTRTIVEVLEEADRIEEVARMLAGSAATEITRRQAREMLERRPVAPSNFRLG
ncbi:DNA repair protein RecN [Kyrpidia tusciae]|uniref:DNA repair protein RecN n=1 Tax=Kyrpidia tusciae (strain DSM 2912 / NBRC 15312 / T2) TaxID=562970 RepID=D5WV96_KYRT2|nr:DNA repair protein RecN [Kyrpidia tusciae]ADG05506.1 DNA repair protein RecN [Kyrpidia tusciae DSM 2912]